MPTRNTRNHPAADKVTPILSRKHQLRWIKRYALMINAPTQGMLNISTNDDPQCSSSSNDKIP